MTNSGENRPLRDRLSELMRLLAEEQKFTSIEIAETLWLALKIEPVSAVVPDTPQPSVPREPRFPEPNEVENRGDASPASNLPKATIATSTQQANVLPSQVLPVWLADPPMLTDPLAIIRALKPLLRQSEVGDSRRLDEVATVDQIARTRLWVPILEPEREPWFDIILVVDRGASMHIWHRLITDLERILRRYGAFRDIRVFEIEIDSSSQATDNPIRLRSHPDHPGHRPSELIDQRGRRIAIILSDCAGTYWWDGTLLPMLQTWARAMPTVIWQMLPEWMWERTALGQGTPVSLSNDSPGAANYQLMVRVLGQNRPDDMRRRVSLPVITTEERNLKNWSLMLAGNRREQTPGFLLPQQGRRIPNAKGIQEIARERAERNHKDRDSSTDISAFIDTEMEAVARERVQRFRQLSSPSARRLIMLLAASPVITLPVIRLIRDSMLYESGSPLPVAEVFLSGLLQRLPEQEEVQLDQVQYDFIPKVREALLEVLPEVETVDVINSVTAAVERRWNQYSEQDFRAFLMNPNIEAPEGLGGMRSFASVTASILEQLGGEYSSLAQQLRYGAGERALDARDTSPVPNQHNGTMMQYFHWYIPDDGTLWKRTQQNAKDLAAAGFTALWLPPACKGIAGKSDVGYGIYDLYDLGEFDQKGSIRTKYGTREEYLDAIAALHAAGIEVYADVVLNHKMGADEAEQFSAIPFSQSDRLNPTGEPQEIKSYTHFYFPGRNGKYSNFNWHWWHFSAVDYNEYNPADRGTVYRLEGKQFDDYVSLKNGNFSYLMGCDLDLQNEQVRNEVTHWGKWYLDTTQVDGFRLDAVKHISSWFFPEWLDELERHVGKALFTVGELWITDLNSLLGYIDSVGGRMSVFDVPLHYNFHQASKSGGDYNMSRILDGTMMKERPTHAITFVESHDSQPLQALESVVEPWFKPLAYALILLRREGYPCVFYADYYGAKYEDWGRDGNRYAIEMASHRWLIDKFLHARINYAYGDQYDYFDHPNIIGWTRLGDDNHPEAMAVIMSNGSEGWRWMEVGQPHAMFIDLTENIKEPIYSNESGWAEFQCAGGSVSVWVQDLKYSGL
jgi:alpha-amylase